MKKLHTQSKFNCLSVLPLLGLGFVVVHALTNDRYGFHRDELATIDDARHLDWGYVAYPPITPFIARVALEAFGTSLVGLRLFSSLAISLAMVLAGLIARELGGSRKAEIITALAVGIAPISLISGALFQYVSFDYLWWVLTAYLVIRLLKSENPRWWLGIGAVIGLGMMTKYTMGLFVAGIVAGVLLTSVRGHLKSPWLWGGVVLSLLLFLPNLLWQVQHDFTSLAFLKAIHERDIRIGRTAHNFIEQFFVCTNLFTVPFWVAGLWHFTVGLADRRYRLLGWMYVVPLTLLLLTQGRSYYLAPAYPMLIAGGVVVWERRLASMTIKKSILLSRLGAAALVLGGVAFGAVMLPVAPVNSRLWQLTSSIHDNFVEEIGWPELVETIAGIYNNLSAEEQRSTGILAGNYGEAGAINLYGPAYRLPRATSGVNSYWLRGYDSPPPQTLIVVGFSRVQAEGLFEDCDLAGHVGNRYGVQNEETTAHPDIFVCRRLRQPWSKFWERFRYYA